MITLLPSYEILSWDVYLLQELIFQWLNVITVSTRKYAEQFPMPVIHFNSDIKYILFYTSGHQMHMLVFL